jgi:iron(III) transport system substrate-binding protein
MKHSAQFFAFGMAVLMAGLLMVSGPAAGQEKHLTVYGSTQEMGVRHITEAFTKDTGIKVDWIRMSTGETLNRIRAEKSNPRASIWLCGPGTAHMVGASEGLLQPYLSPLRSKIARQHMDAQGLWTGVFLTSFVFTSNPTILKERGLKAPTSYLDVLAPEWKGQIAMANPTTSGTGHLFLASVVHWVGEEKAFTDYFKKFHANSFQYPKSGMGPAEMAGRGEIASGITMLADSYYLMQQGHKFILTPPKEGLGFSLEPVSMLKGAPQPEEAKRFIDWILSAQGQRGVYGIFPYPTVVGTNPEGYPKEKAVDIEMPFFKDFDINVVAKQYSELLNRFQKEIMFEAK